MRASIMNKHYQTAKKIQTISSTCACVFSHFRPNNNNNNHDNNSSRWRYFSSNTSKIGNENNSNRGSQTPTGVILNKGYTKSKYSNYFRGWAYQQVFLKNRINFKRIMNQNDNNEDIKLYAAKSNYNDYDRDRILMFQHKSVYTLGRGADENHVSFLDEESRLLLSRKYRSAAAGQSTSRLYVDKFQSITPLMDGTAPIELLIEDEVNSMDEPTAVIAPNGAPIYRIERGGEVTYHGPGQLVCYPLLDLTKDTYNQDLHWYLNSIEEVIIQTLREYGIKGVRDKINTGVWVNQKKIAAVGVSCSRWITTHGFALNIDPDLTFFDTSMIIPCGIEGRSVTSIANVFKENGRDEGIPLLDDVADVVAEKFEKVFCVDVCIGHCLS